MRRRGVAAALTWSVSGLFPQIPVVAPLPGQLPSCFLSGRVRAACAPSCGGGVSPGRSLAPGPACGLSVCGRVRAACAPDRHRSKPQLSSAPGPAGTASPAAKVLQRATPRLFRAVLPATMVSEFGVCSVIGSHLRLLPRGSREPGCHGSLAHWRSGGCLHRRRRSGYPRACTGAVGTSCDPGPPFWERFRLCARVMWWPGTLQPSCPIRGPPGLPSVLHPPARRGG